MVPSAFDTWPTATTFVFSESSASYSSTIRAPPALSEVHDLRLGDIDLKLPDDHQPHVLGPHARMAESHVFEDMMQLVDWIRDGKPSIANAEHARHVIEIIEAGYRAAETGETQVLQTTFAPLPVEVLWGTKVFPETLV